MQLSALTLRYELLVVLGNYNRYDNDYELVVKWYSVLHTRIKIHLFVYTYDVCGSVTK